MIRSVPNPTITSFARIDASRGVDARRPGALRHPHHRFHCGIVIVLTMILFAAMGQEAQAAGSGLPWEAPLERILESIEGPVAKVIAVLIIIVTGLSLAFGDMSGGFRRLIQIVFGLTIAFAATSFFLTFFSFAGGALIN
jgi:type IV secretory pathway VirB2 component (pilin)